MLTPEILVRPLAGAKLVEDYQGGANNLAPFFSGSPYDRELYQRKVDEVRRRFSPARRARMAEAIRPTSPAAAARLDQTVSEGGLFVTTGQQPGLFSGPLFTIYKILSAIRLAKVLESELQTPVTTLFWVASDDHDWEESNHTNVLDRRNQLRRIALTRAEDAAPVSMGRQPLGPSLDGVFDELSQNLPDTDFRPVLIERLRAAYQPDRTVAKAFEELVVDLFSSFDLLVVDGGSPAVKELGAEVMRRELEETAAHERVLAEQTERLVAAGYRAQVAVQPGAANLFYEDEGGRDRLMRDGAGWTLRRSGRRLGSGEVASLLSSDPTRFSANVLLRPVVESAVFPTVAYVGGPGEISYLAQVRTLFRSHGIEMPAIYPRSTATLVEGKVAKVLTKFGLEIEDFGSPVREVASRVIRDELPAELVDVIAELRRQLVAGYGRLAEQAQTIDPTLKGPITGARKTSESQLGDVEKKIVKHLKERNSTVVAQLGKAAANLYPEGRHQERVVNVFSYLARYGPELLPRMAESFEAATPSLG